MRLAILIVTPLFQVNMCMLTYIPAFGNEIGVGRKAPYLLTIIAISELLGKVLMSVVTDQRWIQRRHAYMLVCVTSSITVLCELQETCKLLRLWMPCLDVYGPFNEYVSDLKDGQMIQRMSG